MASRNKMDSEKYVFSEEEDDGDDEDSNDTDHEKNELPQPAYVDEQCLGPACSSGGDCGKKNPARQVSRRPVSGVLVGVRAGRSSTASDQRARGRNLQHRSDYSQVVLSSEEVTTGLGLGVE